MSRDLRTDAQAHSHMAQRIVPLGNRRLIREEPRFWPAPEQLSWTLALFVFDLCLVALLAWRFFSRHA